MKPREVGPRSQRIVAQERRHVAPGSQSFSLMAGLAMARGTGSTLIDEDGNEYIDFIAGIGVGSVGHCHPHYVEALKPPSRPKASRASRCSPAARRPLRRPCGSRAPPRARRRSSGSGAGSTARPAVCSLSSGASSSITWGPSCRAGTSRRTPTAIAVRSSSATRTVGSRAPSSCARSSATRPRARSARSSSSPSRAPPVTWCRPRGSSAPSRRSRASTARS
ncbi:MAG: hypothetical protein DME12_08370 [Candidatus Rokuibacteriota bacterium]|nr:MAG: hypothetical protein DME12_08370 [Candidatus Rokubacteria bacterium]